MGNSISQIYKTHQGKVSDKWHLYVDEWDRLLAPYRDRQINLLEIGVQNGGSLEIWAECFSEALKIIGCDIDQKCAQLSFDDPRIAMVVGDANTDECKSRILGQAPTLDIIIDDGSHNSSNIVRFFGRYFRHLKDDGIYIIEDLHTSYWESFEGGLNYPYSSIAFFKRLADIVNFEHWRNDISRGRYLGEFAAQFGVAFDDFVLARIHSIEFVNSLCIIRKLPPEKNVLGRRLVVGTDDSIASGWTKLNGTAIRDITTDMKDGPGLDSFELLRQNEALKKISEDHEQAIRVLTGQVTDKEGEIQQLSSKLAEQEQKVRQLSSELEEQEQNIQRLSSELAEQKQKVADINKLKSSFQQELANNIDHLNQREQILQGLNAKLLEIYSSSAWKIIVFMWKVRLLMAPTNSQRERFARTVLSLPRRVRAFTKNRKPVVDTREKEAIQNDSQPKAVFVDRCAVIPIVSIIIPVFNAIKYTKECIRSILEFTHDIAIEIIIVNNSSTDGTKKWLENEMSRHTDMNVISLEQNMGFGPAVNIGIKQSKGKFLVILNNDTIVSPHWLSRLLKHMDDSPAIGIISPVTNYVGEGLQVDEDAQNLPASWDLIVEHSKNITNRNELLYEPNRLVFFCVVLRRELVDQIGDFDEGFASGNFEDDDYCLRARHAGYKLAIARNAFVYHHGSVTFKVNQISHTQLMELNRRRFYSKAGRISTSLRSFRYISTHKQPFTISVIVRTKDRPVLLKKALTSLANQTFTNLEVILVNDGGDDVSSLVDEMSPYLSIRYLWDREGQGRTSAINKGLRNVKGEWIGYLDDDDILYPWHFEALMMAADTSRNLIYADYNKALMESAGDVFPLRLIGAPTWNYNRQEFLVQNYLPIHSYIHRVHCIDQVGLWDESLDRLEDYEFLLRLTGLSDFHRIKKVTCEYRYYADVQSSITSDGRKEYLSAIQKIYAKHPVEDEKLLQARQQIIDGLQLQIQQIDQILQRSSGCEAQKEIIRVLAGI